MIKDLTLLKKFSWNVWNGNVPFSKKDDILWKNKKRTNFVLIDN